MYWIIVGAGQMFLLLTDGGCNIYMFSVVLYCVITGQEVPYEFPGFLFMLRLLCNCQRVDNIWEVGIIIVWIRSRYASYRHFLV